MDRKQYEKDSRYQTERNKIQLSSKNQRKKRRRMKYLRRMLILLVLLVLLILAAAAVLSIIRRQEPGIHVDNSTLHSENISMDKLNSPNAILTELKSGETIAQRGAGDRIYPASLTKIMTALVAIENISDLDEPMTRPYDFYQYLYQMDASMAGFEPGETAKARDYIYGVILASGAECCLTLAEAVSGSEQGFVDLMNQKAAELGMDDTHFSNTTGLQDAEHYTTVRDLSLLLDSALKNAEFREVFTSRSYTVQPTNVHPEGFTIGSTLFENAGNTGLKNGEILGGKTGYTDEAGLCLASLAEVDGEEYILVTAHAPGSHETEQYHILDAITVYNEIADARRD